MLDELLDISVSAKQVQRISESYGDQLEQQHQQAAETMEPPALLPCEQSHEIVYTMLDGSLLFIRDKGWTEMKLARLFTERSNVAVQPNRHQILNSLYLGHLGGHQQFLKKLEAYAEPYAQKVFIADGAKWIWNWVEDAYPDCVQILDFYHAFEKLSLYAGFQYGDGCERKKWLEDNRQRLLSGGVASVIEAISKSVPCNAQAAKGRKEVLSYYKANECRMQYHLYLERGLLIGSGPMEAAHRNVIQQRLKLSGQRWSREGAQQITNLRACRKSNQWNQVISLIKNAA